MSVDYVCLYRDHRKLYVGDSRGRVFSWTVSDSQGTNTCVAHLHTHSCFFCMCIDLMGEQHQHMSISKVPNHCIMPSVEIVLFLPLSSKTVQL